MTTEVCAACRRPFALVDDRVAVRVAGHVVEIHQECADDPIPREPTSVGDRLATILEGDAA